MAALFDPEGQIDRAGGGEPAIAELEGALARDHPGHDLGNDHPEIGVALAVDVGLLVQEDAADPDREIGAVDRVEAAQEVLLAFALAAVLALVQAGHDAQEVIGVLVGREREVAGRHHAHRGGGAHHRRGHVVDDDHLGHLVAVSGEVGGELGVEVGGGGGGIG
jgi:hypothetical protein